MPADDPSAVLTGPALLDAITDAMVAFHVRYYHRVPTSARTQELGRDLLACTLEGIYTNVEKTLIELQQQSVVRETRRSFETAMQHRLIAAVERLSDRTVTSFIANHHVSPDLTVALFLLKPLTPSAG